MLELVFFQLAVSKMHSCWDDICNHNQMFSKKLIFQSDSGAISECHACHRVPSIAELLG